MKIKSPSLAVLIFFFSLTIGAACPQAFAQEGDAKEIQRNMLYTIQAISDGDVVMAEKMIDEGMALNPNSPTMYFLLGNLFERKQLVDEAIESYQKAIQIDPDFSRSYYNLGVLLLLQGRSVKASEMFFELSNRQPQFVSDYLRIGRMFILQKDYLSAHRYLRTAVSISPNANAYNDLAVISIFEKDYEKSIEYALKSIEINPQIASAFNNLGVAYANGNKDYARAIEYYKQAVVINSNYSIAYQNMGEAQFLAKDLDAAISSYTTSLEIEPASAQANYGLAAVLAAQGKKFEAIQRLGIALGQEPNLAQLVKKDTNFDLLREESGFQMLIENMPVPEAQQTAVPSIN